MRYVLPLLLAGCAFQWVHPYKSEEAFTEDDFACERIASSEARQHSPTDYSTNRGALYAKCMRSRGWRQQ